MIEKEGDLKQHVAAVHEGKIITFVKNVKDSLSHSGHLNQHIDAVKTKPLKPRGPR